MKKLFLFFAAVLTALAVNAQGTDFAAPGYSCAADDAVLSGGSSGNFYLKTDVTPHCIAWSDVSLSSSALATWTVVATRGCYVSVSLDLGPVISSNKHNFEVKILDDKGNSKGAVSEGGENTASDQVKALDGTILLPLPGTYTIELRNNRDWGKGTIYNVILTYAADAPSELVDVESVALNQDAIGLQLQEVEQLIATVLPSNATDPSVTWLSSDNSIATVSEDGLVTAIAAGTARITAKAGEKTAVCDVVVSAPVVLSTDFSVVCTLPAKTALLDGAVWKMYKDDTYKLYGDGGSNKFYGTASWTINALKGCVISAALQGVEGGHIFELDVYDDSDNLLGTIAQPTDATWWSGIIDMVGTLTLPAAGNYTFKLRNTQEWSSGKIAGVNLSFVEDLPTPPAVAIDNVELTVTFPKAGDAVESGPWYCDDNIPMQITSGDADAYYCHGVDFWVDNFDNYPETELLPQKTYRVRFYVYPKEGYTISNTLTVDQVTVNGEQPESSDFDTDIYQDRVMFSVFFTTGEIPTGLNDIEDGVKAVKFIENGQLFVIKNGVVYNAQGAVVR